MSYGGWYITTLGFGYSQFDIYAFGISSIAGLGLMHWVAFNIYIYQLSLMGDLMMEFMHYIAFSIIHKLLLIGVLIWDLGLLYCISVRYFIYRWFGWDFIQYCLLYSWLLFQYWLLLMDFISMLSLSFYISCFMYSWSACFGFFLSRLAQLSAHYTHTGSIQAAFRLVGFSLHFVLYFIFHVDRQNLDDSDVDMDFGATCYALLL